MRDIRIIRKEAIELGILPLDFDFLTDFNGDEFISTKIKLDNVNDYSCNKIIEMLICRGQEIDSLMQAILDFEKYGIIDEEFIEQNLKTNKEIYNRLYDELKKLNYFKKDKGIELF